MGSTGKWVAVTAVAVALGGCGRSGSDVRTTAATPTPERTTPAPTRSVSSGSTGSAPSARAGSAHGRRHATASPSTRAPGRTASGGPGSRPASPAPDSSTATPGPSSSPAAGSADGRHYDLGAVHAVVVDADRPALVFDRYSLAGGDGPLFGTTEPTGVVGWHTDVPWVNASTRLRTIPVAASVAYLARPTDYQCFLPSGAANKQPPRWHREPLAALRSRAARGDDVVLLTYGDSGLVTRIREDVGC